MNRFEESEAAINARNKNCAEANNSMEVSNIEKNTIVSRKRSHLVNQPERATNESSVLIRKKKRRRDTAKRDYNDDMLVAAINDLKEGQTLIEAATKHNIPRSTLYMRAKALGIQLTASRNEYSPDSMNAAINAVIG